MIVLAEELVCLRLVDNAMVEGVKMDLGRPVEGNNITQGHRFNYFHLAPSMIFTHFVFIDTQPQGLYCFKI